MTGEGAAADAPPPNSSHRFHVNVTEFTDPACPWAWGSEPALRLLRRTLGPSARWTRVFGILFDEDDDPAPDPEAEARWYESFVRDITQHTHAPYARRLTRLTRTSWPASLAAKAAQSQGPEIAERVLRRLRESTFVHGTPADTTEGVAVAVRGVPGLDTDRLLSELAAPETRDAVRADWETTRRPIAEVLDLREGGPHPGHAKDVGDRRRYALPTLLFEGPGGEVCVPGWRSADSYLAAARKAADAPFPVPAPLSPSRALAHWRSLSAPELALLTGGKAAPPEAVRIVTGNGPMWLHPEESAGRRGLGQ